MVKCFTYNGIYNFKQNSKIKANKDSSKSSSKPSVSSKLTEVQDMEDFSDDEDSKESISGGEEDPNMISLPADSPTPQVIDLKVHLAAETKSKVMQKRQANIGNSNTVKSNTKPSKVVIDGLLHHIAPTSEVSINSDNVVKVCQKGDENSFSLTTSFTPIAYTEFAEQSDSTKPTIFSDLVSDRYEEAELTVQSQLLPEEDASIKINFNDGNLDLESEPSDMYRVPITMTIDDTVQKKCTAALDAIRMLKLKKKESSCKDNLEVKLLENDIDNVYERSSNDVSGDIGATLAKESSFSLSCSRLLEMKETETDKVIISRVGVDNIPGLVAWKLIVNEDNTEPMWEYMNDLETGILSARAILNETASSLFLRRTTVRKFVPFGLVALLAEIEEFLLRPVLTDNIVAQQSSHRDLSNSSVDDVVKYWKGCIHLFDKRAASDYYQFPQLLIKEGFNDEGDLFAKVNVCGNCYAACCKLERLIQYIMKINTTDQTSNGSDRIMVLDAMRERGLLDDANILIELPADHLAELLGLPEKVIERANISTLVTRNIEIDETTLKIERADTKNIESIVATFEKDVIDLDDFIEPVYNFITEDTGKSQLNIDKDCMASKYGLVCVADERVDKAPHEYDSSDSNDGDDDHFDASDDEDFIEPAYRLQTEVEVSFVAAEGEETTMSAKFEGNVETIPIGSHATVTDKRVNLSDYYSNIAMIFPFAYGASGDARLANDNFKYCIVSFIYVTSLRISSIGGLIMSHLVSF